ARAIAGIDDVILSIPIGDDLVPLPEGDRYFGFIFASGDTPAVVESVLRRAYHCLDVQIETGEEIAISAQSGATKPPSGVDRNSRARPARGRRHRRSSCWTEPAHQFDLRRTVAMSSLL